MNLLELVPRDIQTFGKEIQDLLLEYPQIEGINIPDVISLPIRSDVAIQPLLERHIFTIPHLRSMDRPIGDSLKLVQSLIQKGLTALLIISGDQPSDTKIKTYPVSTIELVGALKCAFPSIKVYTGLDSYRTQIDEEIAYCQQKLEAGSDGFFTQPFFSIDSAENYLKELTHTEVFIGHCPVVTLNAKKYWETKNKVVFPSEFQPTWSHNSQIAKSLIALTKVYQQHMYFMPILQPVDKYLSSIWD